MLKKKIIPIALLFLCITALRVEAKTTTLQEIQDLPTTKEVRVIPKKALDKNHWAYKTLEDISKKYGLLMGKPDDKFNGSEILTRDEAAFILVNLVGRIEKDRLELSEVEKAQMDILKQELKAEVNTLASKVANLETSVDTLKGSVTNLEAENSKGWKFDYGEKFKITGGIQAQYTGAIQKGADGYSPNFALPYSEIRFSGKVNPKVGYVAAMVPSRLFDGTENGILREAYASIDVLQHHTVYLGQSMVPIGYEGPMNPLSIETIDKSQISRKITDMPDLGIKAEGNWGLISYSVGTYNGNGQNRFDPNGDLGIASWATIRPLYKFPRLGKLELGGGNFIGNNGSYDRNIFSFYTGYKLKKFAVWGEYMLAKGYEVAAQRADGFYAHTSYYLTDKLQLLARYDQFDPNRSTKGNLNREYTIGTNYLLRDNLSLMLGLVEVANQNGKDSQRIEALTQFLF